MGLTYYAGIPDISLMRRYFLVGCLFRRVQNYWKFALNGIRAFDYILYT